MVSIQMYLQLKKVIVHLEMFAKMGDERSLMESLSVMKKTIDSSHNFFSLFPPIGLAVNFLKAVGHLAFYFDPETNAGTSSLWLAFHFHLTNLIFLGTITFVIENIRKGGQSIKTAYREGQGSRRELSPALSQAIDDATSCQITVCKILSIDWRSFFVFIGAIVISTIVQFKKHL